MSEIVLQNGWVQATDPASGNIYYANTITGLTSWDYPEDAGPRPVSSDAELPPGWTAALDPSSGKTYYANPTTGETSWEVPTAAPPKPKLKLDLSEESKAQWRNVLEHVRAQAVTRLSTKAKRFVGIRKFAELAAKRRSEAAARKKAAADAEAEEVRRAAMEAARPKTSILALLETDSPSMPKMNIEEYAETAMNLMRKGMWHRKTTVAKLLSWKNEIIKTSLLKMPTKELEVQAIQCFRNVTGFMGDRSTKKEESGHAEKLLKMCLHAPEELRDEVYCQIIKQTTNNPEAQSTLQGWQLLAICAGAVAPSKDFEPFLLSYCEAHREDPGGVGEAATYAMGRLLKTVALGPRRECPTPMEIEASRLKHPILVRVYHLDGTYDTLPVNSWVTPALLKQMVCQKRGIVEGDAFRIYEMTPDGEERCLDADERIVDLVAYWQRLFEEEKIRGEDKKAKKEKKKALGSQFYRMVFKVHMYFETAIEDTAAHHEMYVQAVYDIVSARYPCGERDCLALASLQLQAEYGDEGLPELASKLSRFLPDKYASSIRGAALAQELRDMHATQAGKSPAEAEREYLAYVKEWQVYGSSFFFVEPQMNAELPDEVFLAVNPKGILIINPDSKEVLGTYPYAEVPTWGHSGSSFVLHIGNLIRQTKMYFSTEQGKEINDLVRAYVNHLAST